MGEKDAESRGLKENVSVQEAEQNGLEQFVRTAKQIINPIDLKPDMLRQLVERIEVREKYRKDGKQMQDIKIIYRFVGGLKLKMTLYTL